MHIFTICQNNTHINMQWQPHTHTHAQQKQYKFDEITRSKRSTGNEKREKNIYNFFSFVRSFKIVKSHWESWRFMRYASAGMCKWCTFIAWIFRSHLTFQYICASHLCDDGTGYRTHSTHTHVWMATAVAASRDTMLVRKCLSNDDTTKMWEKIPFTSFRFLFIDSSSFFYFLHFAKV